MIIGALLKQFNTKLVTGSNSRRVEYNFLNEATMIPAPEQCMLTKCHLPTHSKRMFYGKFILFFLCQTSNLFYFFCVKLQIYDFNFGHKIYLMITKLWYNIRMTITYDFQLFSRVCTGELHGLYRILSQLKTIYYSLKP